MAKLTYRDDDGLQIVAYLFEYDSLGRLIRSTEYGANNTITQRTEHLYDEFNRLSSQSWVIDGDSFSEIYRYNDPPVDSDESVGRDDLGAPQDGSLKQMTTATGDTINYNYDGLKRLSSTAVKNSSGTTLFRTGYAYKAGTATNQTTNRISVYTTWNPDYTAFYSYGYEYDSVGNITKIKDAKNSNRVLATYTYDVQNQLTQEIVYSYDSDGIATTTTYAYTYDTAGNILSESKNGTVTKTYIYGNSEWNDLLTEYDGGKIAYEGQTYSETKNRLGVVTATSVTGTPTSGNPISYYSGVRWTLDWEQGRNLKQNYNFSTNLLVESTSKVDTETTLNYSYDLDGIRTSKTYVVEEYGYSPSSGGGVVASIGENALEPNATSYVRYLLSTTTVEHNYVTQNGKVVRETITSGASTKVLDFIYDASGRPFALMYKNGTAATETLYYVLNLQGDVVALMDADRNIKAEYTYNAWGEILTATGTMASINPLRYRGYYYDSETGFYYLQSRYYDPTLHRFINADSYASTGQGFVGTNMFAYCGNNPIIFKDPSGVSPVAITVGVTATGVFVITIAVFGIAVATYELLELAGEGLEWIVDQAEKLGAKIFFEETVNIEFAVKSAPRSLGETLGLNIDENLSRIARKYKIKECLKAAEAMKKFAGNAGKVIWLYFPTAYNGYVCCDRYREAISENGNHFGYLYNGIVYCNVYPEGREEHLWINSFYCADGSEPIVRYLG